MVSCPAGQVYDEVLVALYAKVQRWRTVWGLVNISDGLYNDTAANVTLVNMSRQVAENLTVWASGQPLFALDAESKYFRLRVLCQCFTGPLPSPLLTLLVRSAASLPISSIIHHFFSHFITFYFTSISFHCIVSHSINIFIFF